MARLILLVAFAYLLSRGCDQAPEAVQHPGAPNHLLRVEGDVQFEADVSWTWRSGLATQFWATNVGESAADMSMGECTFRILAYTSSASDAKLIWHNAPPASHICLDQELMFRVPPDTTIELNEQAYINGKRWRWPIPRGKWYFVVEAVREDSIVVRLPAGFVTVR